MMPFAIEPLHEKFGAEIVGVDLTRPLDDATWTAIDGAFVRYSVLVFRDQDLSKQQHVAFSRRFGELEFHVVKENIDPECPEIFVLGNVEDRGGATPFASRVNETWHSDSSFLAAPSMASLLYCRIAPGVGADTQLVSARAAYEDLPMEIKRRIQGRTVVFSYAHFHDEILVPAEPERQPLTAKEKADLPDVRHPLVCLHPANGSRSIFISEVSAREISGLEESEISGLVDALCRHITQPEAVYTHRWRVGDLLIWDNRCTMHRATIFDAERERRLMHRTTIVGEVPIPAPPEEI